MRSRLARVVALAAVLGLASSCLNHRFTTGAPPSGVTIYTHHPYFIAGLIGEAVVDVDRLCPDGVASIRNFASGIDLILTIVTVSIYSPRTTEVVCAGGPGSGPTPRGYAVQAVPTEDGR